MREPRKAIFTGDFTHMGSIYLLGVIVLRQVLSVRGVDFRIESVRRYTSSCLIVRAYVC
jgi:hypothetical protein